VVAGPTVTRAQILLYTLPMAAVAIAPWALALTGAIYGAAAILLSAVFLYLALRVALSRESDPAAMGHERRLFAFSILYLFVLFGALVADRLVLA
jgi:heme o synthase